eukprot:m.68808 g.68808  ORF g.68808 m.68808 type:complete len:52 (-) comp8258_c2_seq2:527-682(-)
MSIVSCRVFVSFVLAVTTRKDFPPKIDSSGIMKEKCMINVIVLLAVLSVSA